MFKAFSGQLTRGPFFVMCPKLSCPFLSLLPMYQVFMLACFSTQFLLLAIVDRLDFGGVFASITLAEQKMLTYSDMSLSYSLRRRNKQLGFEQPLLTLNTLKPLKPQYSNHI